MYIFYVHVYIYYVYIYTSPTASHSLQYFQTPPIEEDTFDVHNLNLPYHTPTPKNAKSHDNGKK